MKKYIAEFIGTCILVLVGCGTAVVTGGDIVATSLAFGLSIIATAYVIGNISGCHLNPAVSLSMLLTEKLEVREFIKYVCAQILGAIAGTGILYAILISSEMGTDALGTNGYWTLSAINVSMLGAFLTEVVLTFIFIYTILGVTNDKKKDTVAGIVIGLTLTFVHLIGINITGTSVNPARSIAPALFIGGKSLKQLWVFIIAPLVGSAIASYTYKYLNK